VDQYPPLPGLRRVVVLARHGNRAPNPEIQTLCPNYMKTLEGFGVAPAALSRVGMSENEENGLFMRKRYAKFLPDGPYPYDGTFSFFSERVERNVVSTEVFARGMFPLGTGIEGFDPHNPNIIPISTTQDGADVIMNCPRDGPCQRALGKDKKKWEEEHAEKAYKQNKAVIDKVSKACGFELKPGLVYENKTKGLVWALKNVMDGFSFAENEGLDATMGGRISKETIHEFHEAVEVMVQDMNFGKDHQLTYWAGDFIPTVLELARLPLLRPVNKFHLFLNHRELLYAVATLWGINIHFPGSPEGSLPSGSSLVMEVYDEGLRLFFWAPSKPTWELKSQYLKELLPMRYLFADGTMYPTQPEGCGYGKICPVDTLANTFVKWVQRTGTYVDICDVPLEDTYFARGEISLGVMEHWVQPDLPSTARLSKTGHIVRPERLSEEKGATMQAPAALSLVISSVLVGSLSFLLGRWSKKEKPLEQTYLAMA